MRDTRVHYINKTTRIVNLSGGKSSIIKKDPLFFSDQTIGISPRTTAGGMTIRDGKANIARIDGRTVKWNQQINVNDFSSANKTTILQNTNEYISADLSAATGTYTGIRFNIKGEQGHVYFVNTYIKLENNTSSESIGVTGGNSYSGLNGFKTDKGVWVNIMFVDKLIMSNGYVICYAKNARDGILYVKKTIHLVDLTSIFGEGNEPTTTDEFTQYIFGKNADDVTDEEWQSISAYDEGSLRSFVGKELVSKGRNIIDFPFEDNTFEKEGVTITYNKDEKSIIFNGTAKKIASSTFYVFDKSEKIEKSDYIISCKVEGEFTGGVYFGVDTYSDGVYKGMISASVSNKFIGMIKSSNYGDMSFGGSLRVQIPAGSTCKNLKFSELQIIRATNNLPYTPYFESRITIDPTAIMHEGKPLFPYGLCSAGDVHDEIDYKRGVAVKRVSSVDLGTLRWEYNTTAVADEPLFKATINDKSLGESNRCNIKCSMYNEKESTYQSAIKGDKTIRELYHTSVKNIMIVDSSYNDVNVFASAMQGVMLYYKLADPIEVPISLPSTYKVENGGTEHITADAMTLPMEASIGYKTAK